LSLLEPIELFEKSKILFDLGSEII
jgi:hypothetical protein